MNLKLNIFKNKLHLQKEKKEVEKEDSPPSNLGPNLDLSSEKTIDPISEAPETKVPLFVTL